MQMCHYTAVDQEIIPSEEARIAVSSRAVRFGDGVFETLRIDEGVPYQWDIHLDRLAQGLHALRIDMDVRSLKPIARMLLQKNQLRDGFLRIAISRGGASEGYRPLSARQPHCIIETMPPRPVDDTPCSLYISEFQRPSFACMPANAKLSSAVMNTLALLEAADRGCEDALIFSASGHIAETASANLFWLKGENLFTPSLETGCVAGTTRAAIIRLWPGEVYEVMQPLTSLEDADALMLCNVRHGVRACTVAGYRFKNHAVIEHLQSLLIKDRTRERMLSGDYWLS